MKKKLTLASVLAALVLLFIPMTGFAKEVQKTSGNKVTYDNGTYRGTFGEGGTEQVGIQFRLENNILKNLSFRHLFYKGIDYLQIKEGTDKYPVLLQNQELLKYLDNKPVESIYELYTPGNIVGDIDTFTGATIRGSKVLSAIQDALNRGPYSPSGEVNRTLGDYEDGTYRGVFSDSGIQQVSIEFNLEKNTIKNLSYRHLFYKDTDYRKIGADHKLYPVWLQNQQILEYLKGKPLTAIYDLYKPGDIIETIDTYTGATVRASKVLSAIKDGLNRGTYKPSGEAGRILGEYKDGTYRGLFSDGGTQQVSIQFNLENNTLKDLSYRYLFYKDTNFGQAKPEDKHYPVLLQNQQILDYLSGKPLVTIFDLHKPGNFITDIDTYTGATVRASKVLSAIRDGLNRGPYKMATTTASPAPTPAPSPDVVTTPDTITTPSTDATQTTESSPVTAVDRPAQKESAVESTATLVPPKTLPKTGQLPMSFFLVLGAAAIIAGTAFLRKVQKE